MEKTCFIYIHGVQPDIKTADIKGYSEEFHTKILKQLKRLGKDTSQIKRIEVNWADITFGYKKRLAELQFDLLPKRGGKIIIRKALRNFIYPAVVDILFYVKNKGSADAPGEMLILKRLHNSVKKAKQQGYKNIIIFAHSLGSVAAYDYIFRFRKRYAFPEGLRLSALVTFGSPIPLFASGMGYPISRKIKRPAYAKKWYNFWDHDDGIACRCEPHFPKAFVKGFLKDIPVDTAFLNPLKAHKQYWHNAKVIRKMAMAIAGEI